MAKLSLPSRRDGAGHVVHPVARVTAILRPDDPDPTLVRVTLRSDGVLLRQARGTHPGAHWSTHSTWLTVTTGFPCHGAQAEMAAQLVRLVNRAYRTTTAVPESL